MSSADTPKTVFLDGADHGNVGPQQEAAATVAIVPGMLVERVAAGVRPHPIAAGAANTHFAEEYSATGGTIDRPYAIADLVQFKTAHQGARVYAFLKAATDAAKGAMMVSAGDGSLAPLVAATGGTVVAQALEAVDNTPGAGGMARIRVEVVPATYIAPVP